jgi:hypothetical protein
MAVQIMYRVDIGHDPGRCYAAVITRGNGMQKGIKGNSIRQLMRRVNEQICSDEQQNRRFPLEQEEPKRIITPGGFGYGGD